MSESNGNGVVQHAAPKKTQPTIEQMREQAKYLRVANKLKNEQVVANILEGMDNFSYANFGGAGTDMMEPFFRTLNQGTGYAGLAAQPSDRSRGRKWPVWSNDTQLNQFRMASRILWATNSYAIGLGNNLTNYVIGKGMTAKVNGKNTEEAKAFAYPQGGAAPEPLYAEDSPTPLDNLVSGVKDWLGQFAARNNWTATSQPEEEREDGSTLAGGSCKERETFWRTIRDGDGILRLWRNDDGTVDVRFVDPELVWGTPNGKTYEDGWSFGIQHKVYKIEERDEEGNPTGKMITHHDRERIVAYFIRSHEPDENNNNSIGGEIVKACDIIHIKTPGEDAEVKHGTPMFSFDTLAALMRAVNGQRCASLTAAYQASIAQTWKHNIGTKAEISGIQNGPSVTLGGPNNGPIVGTQRIAAPAILRTPNSTEPVDLPTSNIPAYQSAFQGDLRQAAAAFSASEAMVSADASNSNMASLIEAGTPFVNNAEAMQEHFKAPFQVLYWRVIQHAVKCDKLLPQALTLIDITVEASLVHRDNKGEMAQVMSAELEAKTSTPDIWAAKLGNDPKEIEAYWKEHSQQPGAVPGQEQPGGLPEPGTDPDQSQAAKIAAMKQGKDAQESLWVDVPADVLALASIPRDVMEALV